MQRCFKIIDLAIKNNSALHLIGLIQEEGVHAVTRHCVALLKLCKQRVLKTSLFTGFPTTRYAAEISA